MDSKNIDIKHWFYVIVGLVLMFGVGFLPEVEPLTHQGMQMLGIFLGLLWLWTTCGMGWPSLLGIVAMCLVEGYNAGSVWKLSFGDIYAMQTCFIMALVAAIEMAGVNDHIVNWFMSRKIINGRPWVFTLIFFFAVWAVGALINGTVAFFFCWSLLITICEKFGIQKGEKWASMMFVGIMIIANTCFVQWPFKGMSIIFLGVYYNSTGSDPVMLLNWLAVMTPIILGIIVAYWLSMRYIFRCDVSKLSAISTADVAQEKQPFTKVQLVLIGALVCFMAGYALPSILPATNPLCVFLNRIGLAGVVFLVFAVVCFIKIDGEAVTTFEKVQHKVPWDMVFMTATIMALASMMTADTTGIKILIADMLGPILAGKSGFIFMVVLIAAGVILTNIFNNMVLGFIMLTAVLEMIASGILDVNPIAAITMLILAVNSSFTFPSGSMQAALLHSHPWLSSKEVYLYGTFGSLVIIVMTIVLGIPLSGIFY